MKKTVLVIDDDSDIRKTLVFYLKLDNYETYQAGSGKEGLELAWQQRPNLILCDLLMPEMDGYEVLAELLKTPETAAIPFIFLTGLSDWTSFRRGMELGADDYLTKPIDRKVLQKAIQARLSRQATYQASRADLLGEVGVAADGGKSSLFSNSKELSLELHRALNSGELEMYYQLQLDLSSYKPIGMEALLRWQHPQFGLLGPDKFIGLAEKTEIIHELTTWTLLTACQQAQAWQSSYGRGLRMAVNISATQFNKPGLAQRVVQVLKTTGLDPKLLELELTESVLISNKTQTIEELGRLSQLGVRLSLDDFGTGYSSLAYLQNLCFNSLKLDRSFIEKVPGTTNQEILIHSIIQMARALRLEVVAEGIETSHQLGFLVQEGCEIGQGFLFSQPLPDVQIEDVLKSNIQLNSSPRV